MNRTALILAAAGMIAPAALAQNQGAKPDKPTWVPVTGQPATQPAKKIGDKAEDKKLEPIYDESADAKQQIAAALAKAKKENRRVLIQWGGNWCGWCRMLHHTMSTNAKIKRELQYEYDVVLIDIGHWNKNLDLAASYGADLKSGVPYLTVLDSSGKTVTNQPSDSLERKGPDGKSLGGDEAGHDAAKVLAFLKANEATPLQADAVLKDAIDQAKSSDRKVFVHFGAPWCPWCHRLDDWLAREDIAPLIAKDFVEVKIDQDRMPGAPGVEERIGMPKDSGIPWFAFLDPRTEKPMATSTGPKGNTGFPSEDEEINHFMAMLDTAHKNLTATDLAKIRESLVGERSKPTRH